MTEKLSILCFGNSLTAGFHSYGLEFHPYAQKLVETIKNEFPGLEVQATVAGQSGDLVVSPPGAFLSRIEMKCDRTNDLGYGYQPDKIYSAIQKSWNVALETGAKVLALTIPECKARIGSLDERRSKLNSYILAHQAEGLRIPYHSASPEFQENMFDDGLHLTPAGYDFMGTIIAEHLVSLLNAQMEDKDDKEG
ncbi:SGNH hydrolase [Penicillium macrosclerotiorum]|uniref:SGNH hydrolase n=1 Tax=Penicillium macrosclerotiorum TaxID=303699 RepID=UPI002547EA7F|nr:SGNH hydrolase [Penicillium macrosclerotiorum]KAJ5690560.1 SGNH hydrolase [Penicillium macrosclerotiorum]